MAKIISDLIALIFSLFLIVPPTPSPPPALTVFAQDLTAPRDLVWDLAGYLLASIPKLGKVVAISPTGHITDVITQLNRPHGLAFYHDRLYIAQSHQVSWYNYDPSTHVATNPHVVALLPNAGSHFTRSIIFSQDQLFISIGSSCNACQESDWRRAKILVTSPDGGELQVYASGLRNSVFLATHPTTGELWATDMGRDFLGDHLPPDEINIISRGKDYGWPNSYGGSRIDLPAHVAPLGLTFLSPTQLLVALHGSWNSTVPVGYKIITIDLTTNIISDFLTTGIQRPVDILIHPQTGDIYISDDQSGNIYKYTITHP